jgi:hypothetical protein
VEKPEATQFGRSPVSEHELFKELDDVNDFMA